MTTPLDLDAVEAIPRFNPSLNCRTCEGDMQPSSHGDWYNVDDAQTVIDTLTAELRAARERIAGLEADAARLDWIIDNAAAIRPNLSLDNLDDEPAWSVRPAMLSSADHDDLRQAIDTARTATPRTERECPRCGKRTQPDDAHTCSPQATPRADDARESEL